MVFLNLFQTPSLSNAEYEFLNSIDVNPELNSYVDSLTLEEVFYVETEKDGDNLFIRTIVNSSHLIKANDVLSDAIYKTQEVLLNQKEFEYFNFIISYVCVANTASFEKNISDFKNEIGVSEDMPHFKIIRLCKTIR